MLLEKLIRIILGGFILFIGVLGIIISRIFSFMLNHYIFIIIIFVIIGVLGFILI